MIRPWSETCWCGFSGNHRIQGAVYCDACITKMRNGLEACDITLGEDRREYGRGIASRPVDLTAPEKWNRPTITCDLGADWDD